MRDATDARLVPDVLKFGRDSEWCVGDRRQGGEQLALDLWERYKGESAEAFATAELGGMDGREEKGLEEIAFARAGSVVAGLFDGETFVRGQFWRVRLGSLGGARGDVRRNVLFLSSD